VQDKLDLQIGPTRSLNALALTSPQSVPGKQGRVPARRTLGRWSVAHEWDRRAREHDAAVAAEAQHREFQRQVAERERRRSERLQFASRFKALVADGLTHVEERHPDGRPKRVRSKTWREVGGDEVDALVKLFRTAEATERADLPDVAPREPAATQPAAQRQVVTLTPEAMKQLFYFLADAETIENTERALGPLASQSSADGSDAEHAPISMLPDVIDADFFSEAG
jgi:hypothetical protein